MTGPTVSGPTTGGPGGRPGIGTRVLVPLDGTAFAEQALPVARLVARLAGGTLVLAHVVESSAPVVDMTGAASGVIVDDPRTTRERRRAARDYLDDVVARMTRGERARSPGAPVPQIPTADDEPLPAGSREAVSGGAAAPPEGRFGDLASAEVPTHGVLLEGEPAYALHEAAATHGADLIVMARHDRSALERVLLGSTAERLARDPGAPVLIVRRADRAERSVGRLTRGQAARVPLPRRSSAS